MFKATNGYIPRYSVEVSLIFFNPKSSNRSIPAWHDSIVIMMFSLFLEDVTFATRYSTTLRSFPGIDVRCLSCHW